MFTLFISSVRLIRCQSTVCYHDSRRLLSGLTNEFLIKIVKACLIILFWEILLDIFLSRFHHFLSDCRFRFIFKFLGYLNLIHIILCACRHSIISFLFTGGERANPPFCNPIIAPDALGEGQPPSPPASLSLLRSIEYSKGIVLISLYLFPAYLCPLLLKKAVLPFQH